MRTSFLAALGLLTTATASAQLQEGDFLVGSFATSRLNHYLPDGTPVIQVQGVSDLLWQGAAVTPEGNWATSFRTPASGVLIFDPSGTEIRRFTTPQVGQPGDVNVFPDGTLAVVDVSEGEIEYYTQLGVYVGTISTPAGINAPFGATIDTDETIWVCNRNGSLVWHLERDGTQLPPVATSPFPADVDISYDETLWTVHADSGRIEQHTQGGALLGSFPTALSGNAAGIAVAPDGSVWVGSWTEGNLYHYSADGVVLGAFPIALGSTFMTIHKRRLGVRYCSPATPNSTGTPSRLTARGSSRVQDNDVELTAEDLPPGEFGYFLVSTVQGNFQPPGSSGAICIANPIGRYNQIANIIQGPVGSITIDLDALPTSPPTQVAAGDTWHFQCWHRDPGTSNFTDALSITFH
ncbi:MAG: hypothetical protein GY711_27520 [bacterium]|nr:hypothetical protein [bacterium]